MKTKSKLGSLKIAALLLVALFMALTFSSASLGSFAAQFPLINRLVNVFNGQGEEITSQVKLPKEKKQQSIILSLNPKTSEAGHQNYQKVVQEIGLTSEQQLKESVAYRRLLDDQKFLVLEKNPEISQGSSISDSDYLVIDKQEKVVLTLAMLFKDDQYQQVIKNEIFRQIEVLMEQKQGYHYYTQEELLKRGINPDTLIGPETVFTINDEHQLVISLPRYLLTTHQDGQSTFVIPGKTIESLLINSSYLH